MITWSMISFLLEIIQCCLFIVERFILLLTSEVFKDDKLYIFIRYSATLDIKIYHWLKICVRMTQFLGKTGLNSVLKDFKDIDFY